MSKFIITYLGGNKPASPEEGKQHFAKYQQWLKSLGAAAISPANPLKGTTTICPDDTETAGGSTSMSGFAIVEVETIHEAIGMAKACPFLEIGGSLEVSEIMQMPSQKNG